MIKSNKSKDLTVIPGVAVLFWGGPFSQWYPEYNEKTNHPAAFTVDGVTYDRAEKYMMAQKAVLFGDEVALAKIMESSSPKDIKAMGRAVRGFQQELWDQHADEIVFRGNQAKFQQNQALKELLLSTGDLPIAEASPYDRVWGIGLSAVDPRAADPARWLGTNRLGKVLVRVRTQL